MNVDDKVSNLKNDFAVVDAVGIYDSSISKFTYQDEDLGDIDFFHSMLAAQCLDKVEFLYFDHQDFHFFIRSLDKNQAIFRLKKEMAYNKVLLELRSSSLLSGL